MPEVATASFYFIDVYLYSLQVEPQEKKKTPKGRAKKRMQYVRRFVNQKPEANGKRKMNVNSESKASATVPAK
jgi:hypothetical protein